MQISIVSSLINIVNGCVRSLEKFIITRYGESQLPRFTVITQLCCTCSYHFGIVLQISNIVLICSSLFNLASYFLCNSIYIFVNICNHSVICKYNSVLKCYIFKLYRTKKAIFNMSIRKQIAQIAL